MAAKKTTSKTTKKATKKTATKRSAVTGGDAPAAAQAISPPPPPDSNEAYLERLATINAIASQFNTSDHLAIVRASDAPTPYTLRRPTGIMELDLDLGGGWPAGGMCMLSGPDNAGKSWLLYLTMAMQQKLYGDKCIMAVAPTEGGFSFETAMRVGMDVEVPDPMIRDWSQWNTQRGLAPYTAEDIQRFKRKTGELFMLRGSTGEEILTQAQRIAESNTCSIIAIDSVQGLQPAANADKTLTDNEKMAAHANMMGRFLTKYIPITTGLNGLNETTLLMTQQVRQNMKKAEAPSHMQKYLSDYAISGARSVKHYKLIDLVLDTGSIIKETVAGTGRVATGKVVKWKTEKGKAGTHDNITGEVKYSYNIPTGVDLIQSVIDAAQQRGVIQKQGSKVVVVQHDTGRVLDDFTCPSMKAFKLSMSSDFDFELAVRQEVLAAAWKDDPEKKCIYR